MLFNLHKQGVMYTYISMTCNTTYMSQKTQLIRLQTNTLFQLTALFSLHSLYVKSVLRAIHLRNNNYLAMVYCPCNTLHGIN